MLMKAKVISILALLLMAATGTMAQTEVTQANVKCQQYSYYDALQGTTNKNSLNSAPPTAVVNITLAEAEAFGAAVSCPTTDWIVVYAKDGDNYKWTSKNKTGEQTSVPYGGRMGAWTMLINSDVYGCSSDPNSQLTVYISKGLSSVAVTGNSDGTATPTYWSTYYNASQAFTADANTTVYQAAVNSGKTAVVLTEVTGREIPAGKGVVLKSSAATITLTPTTTTTQTLEGNELTGVDVATTAPSNAYCLSKETTGSARGVGFYTYTGTIPAHRAYLVVAGGPSLTRGFLGFGDDDNTTGISLPEAVVIENDDPIYDLSGRRIIGQPQKGIYVKNGKKVVIK